MIGIYDSVAYLITIGVLFFPVFWFIGYFFWQALHWERDSKAGALILVPAAVSKPKIDKAA